MVNQILIRPGLPADLDDVFAIHTQARNAYYAAGGLVAAQIDTPVEANGRRAGWARAIARAEGRVLCAVVSDVVVGVAAMCSIHADPRTGSRSRRDGDPDAVIGELRQIHVRPDHWNGGIGSALHAGFVQFLRDTSASFGLLEAWERNERGHAFYTRHGWRPDGHRRPGPGGASYLCMRLAPPGRERAGQPG